MQCSSQTRAGTRCKNTCNTDDATTCHVHAETPRKEREGRLYVLSNPRIEGLKIGWTAGRAHTRASALSTTGVPMPFVVVYESDVVRGAEACERRVFKALSASRVAASREFFDTTVDAAKRAIAAVVGENGHAAAATTRAEPVLLSVEDGVDAVTLLFDDVTVTVTRPRRADAQAANE